MIDLLKDGRLVKSFSSTKEAEEWVDTQISSKFVKNFRWGKDENENRTMNFEFGKSGEEKVVYTLQKVYMAKVGDMVWKAGGAFDREDLVEVTEDNVDIINKLWNRLYFDSKDAAYQETMIAHGQYGGYYQVSMMGF